MAEQVVDLRISLSLGVFSSFIIIILNLLNFFKAPWLPFPFPAVPTGLAASLWLLGSVRTNADKPSFKDLAEQGKGSGSENPNLANLWSQRAAGVMPPGSQG